MPTVAATGGPPSFPQTTVSSPLGDMIEGARDEVNSLVGRIRAMNPDPLSDEEMEVLVARMANEQQGIADSTINSIDLGTTPFALAGMLANSARSRQRSSVDVGSANITMSERDQLFRNMLSQGSLEANALGLDLSALDLRERSEANARAAALQASQISLQQQQFSWTKDQANLPRLDMGPYGPQPSNGQGVDAFNQARGMIGGGGNSYRPGTMHIGNLSIPTGGFY